MAELYLVRHAQASFGTTNYDELSELGRKQSIILGQYFSLSDLSFDQLISGNLIRHGQTLDGICEGMGMVESPSYQCHPGLDEYPFEALFRSYSQLHPDDEDVLFISQNTPDKKSYFKLLKKVLMAWNRAELKGLPEQWSDFEIRVAGALRGLQETAGTSRRLLVVSSGGAISHIVGAVLRLAAEDVFELNLQLRNSCITRLYIRDEKILLSEFNSVSHLEQPGFRDLITYA
jgi:broad specificity phosphatase PhoE